MLTSDFDYDLPEELIAQFPTQKRAESKMLVLNKEEQTLPFSLKVPLPE